MYKLVLFTCSFPLWRQYSLGCLTISPSSPEPKRTAFYSGQASVSWASCLGFLWSLGYASCVFAGSFGECSKQQLSAVPKLLQSQSYKKLHVTRFNGLALPQYLEFYFSAIDRFAIFYKQTSSFISKMTDNPTQMTTL